MTINAGAKLPNDFEYFQLLNLFGTTGQSPSNGDWTGFFTEINLRRPIAKDNPYLSHLDWTGQLADGSSPSDVLRLGVRWRLHDTPGLLENFFTDVLKLRYAVSFHVLETDGSGGQLEHVYRREFSEGRFYIAGFIDHNINEGGFESTWVTEHQAGVRLHGPLYAVAEFRYTDFELPGFRSGWGFGLEYIIRFR
ncbi:hypothetical protein Pla8534_25930 [Lignipirellula cremea]|uniref:Uncharacterized protein n=2 Tax=Lignipirellula cremea TaxID=2528010 RepID=A0A518DSG3_9BACT|nr:hypothetical protein Pla8534_25930 [Lignipirellula cremea]